MFIVKWNLVCKGQLYSKCSSYFFFLCCHRVAESHLLVWLTASSPVKVKSLTQTVLIIEASVVAASVRVTALSLLPSTLALYLLYALAVGMVHWGLTSANRAQRHEAAHPVCFMLRFLPQISPFLLFSLLFSKSIFFWSCVSSMQFTAVCLFCWIFLSTAMQCVGSLFPTKFLLSAEGNELT